MFYTSIVNYDTWNFAHLLREMSEQYIKQT